MNPIVPEGVSARPHAAKPRYGVPGEREGRRGGRRKLPSGAHTYCLISALCIRSFPLMLESFFSAFLDTFFDFGKFLLQLVPVVLQAFPFIVCEEKPAETRAASAPATTAGASSHDSWSGIRSYLTHRNHLLSVSYWVFLSSMETVCFGHRVKRRYRLMAILAMPWSFFSAAVVIVLSSLLLVGLMHGESSQ